MYAPLKKGAGNSAPAVVRAVQDVMSPVGNSIYKRGDRLEEALDTVLAIKDGLPKLAAADPHYLAACHEAAAMVLSAELFYRTSLARPESRGWHLREDFPERDDANCLKWIDCGRRGWADGHQHNGCPREGLPGRAVIKFMLAARRKPGDTQQKYFYEWGVIHVALMITTPSVMRTFRRYAQHFTVDGVDGGALLYPLSEMAWDNFADHWLERAEDNLVPFRSDDYMQRMHPHNFGDNTFVIEMTREVFAHEEPDFRPGGVKLLHFVKRRDGLGDDEFAVAWRERHAPTLLGVARRRPGAS